VAVGAGYLHIDAFTLYGYVAIFVPTSVLQGMKRPLFAIWLGLARQVVAPFILFTLFTQVLGYPITALWLTIFAIVWTSAMVALWFAGKTIRKVEAAD
jgi:Na+-driven multidrug efflux pump